MSTDAPVRTSTPLPGSDAQVTSVQPTFGPLAGGTVLTVTGIELGSVRHVVLGGYIYCQLINQ